MAVVVKVGKMDIMKRDVEEEVVAWDGKIIFQSLLVKPMQFMLESME